MNGKEPMNMETAPKNTRGLNKIVILVIAGFIGLLVLISGYYGYTFASSPSHMRSPSLDHYHFRTQLQVNGETVDFSAKEFQQDYDKNSCSTELSGQPIDFHDEEGQMTHIHWNGVTGGELLKYYGWNLTGGNDGSLGTRFDQGMMSMHDVPIYGDLLPSIPEGSEFYVYIGDENHYDKREWQEFLDSDLEKFFGVNSKLDAEHEASGFNIFNLFSSKAYAHGGVDDGDSEAEEGESEEERLSRINNLIGNLVIFVQPQEPTDEEIKAKFNNLAPLTDSVCGG